MRPPRSILMLFCLFLFFVSCSDPIEQPVRIDRSTLLKGIENKSPVRIHHVNGSVFLAQKGFTIRNDTVSCIGELFGPLRTDSTVSLWNIPVDSIAGLEYFGANTELRGVGKMLIGVTSTAYAVAGAIILLKAIFGSCPTFYTSNGEEDQLEAEGFSYSIGQYFESGDLDQLRARPLLGGEFTLSVRNEALETHYINQIELWAADHPSGTQVYPGAAAGEVYVMSPKAPARARSMSGHDILAEILERDNTIYETEEESTARLLTEKKRDFLEFEFDNPNHQSSITIAVRGRNSLKTTVLLYDVMMRNQGPLVMDWISRVNEDPLYAWRLYRWYREHSGVQLLVEDNGSFEVVAWIPDTGPIAWKVSAVQVPVDSRQDRVRVRLAFLPESWSIDWVGYDDQDHGTSSITKIPPKTAKNNRGMEESAVASWLRDDDDEYLLTYPGTKIDLGFDLPPSVNAERTLLVWSKGYYIEWVRGEWLKARDDVIVFDIRNPGKISEDLARMWQAKRKSLEEQFYAQRIPLAK